MYVCVCVAREREILMIVIFSKVYLGDSNRNLRERKRDRSAGINNI